MIVSWLLMLTFAASPIFPIEQVQRGQTGYCLTVFEEQNIERMPFTVKGVLYNYIGPKRHVIMIELTGSQTAHTGVAAGMSGSPCYVNEQFMGALAYSFQTFAKDAIAGVTPAADMLALFDLPATQPTPHAQATFKRSSSWFEEQTHRSTSTDLKPIATPLSISGMVPEVFEYYAPMLKNMGFEPTLGSGSGTPSPSSKASQTLRPGDAVAAQIVTGDLNISAAGTVSWVQNNQVLAFGHPFMSLGNTSLPMSQARVIQVMSSLERSFKMAQPTHVVGSIVQDRISAIAGELGRPATMIPVDINIETNHQQEHYHLDIAQDPYLSPRAFSMAVANTLVQRLENTPRATAHVQGLIECNDHISVPFEEVYSSKNDSHLLMRAALDMGQVFQSLLVSGFGAPTHMRVRLHVTIEPEYHVYHIEQLSFDGGPYYSGETLNVTVHLREEHFLTGPTYFTRTIPIMLPNVQNKTEYLLTVGHVGTAENISDTSEPMPYFEKIEDVAAYLTKRRSDGYVYALLVNENQRTVMAQQRVHAVPDTALFLFREDKTTKHMRERGIEHEYKININGMIMGEQQRSITVQPSLRE